MHRDSRQCDLRRPAVLDRSRLAPLPGDCPRAGDARPTLSKPVDGRGHGRHGNIEIAGNIAHAATRVVVDKHQRLSVECVKRITGLLGGPYSALAETPFAGRRVDLASRLGRLGDLGESGAVAGGAFEFGRRVFRF